MAYAVMQRLDSNLKLSEVLPLAKTLAGLNEDDDIGLTIDVLTFGFGDLPSKWKTGNIASRLRSMVQLEDLLRTSDVTTITMDSAIAGFQSKQPSDKTHMIAISVFKMEMIKESPEPAQYLSEETANMILRTDAYYRVVQSALYKSRNFVYGYASQVWQEGVRDKDRINLLGPDYRIVLDSLDVLDTEVGNDLLAALDLVGSENPASWKLCALGCRNVVLQLGRHLWNTASEDYASTLLGKIITLKGEREKNKLSAYIDVHWKEASKANQRLLKEAHDLVLRVYDSGSKGKSDQIRHSEVQQLIVDTFRLVELLRETTGLVRLSNV